MTSTNKEKNVINQLLNKNKKGSINVKKYSVIIDIKDWDKKDTINFSSLSTDVDDFFENKYKTLQIRNKIKKIQNIFPDKKHTSPIYYYKVDDGTITKYFIKKGDKKFRLFTIDTSRIGIQGTGQQQQQQTGIPPPPPGGTGQQTGGPGQQTGGPGGQGQGLPNDMNALYTSIQNNFLDNVNDINDFNNKFSSGVPQGISNYISTDTDIQALKIIENEVKNGTIQQSNFITKFENEKLNLLDTLLKILPVLIIKLDEYRNSIISSTQTQQQQFLFGLIQQLFKFFNENILTSTTQQPTIITNINNLTTKLQDAQFTTFYSNIGTQQHTYLKNIVDKFIDLYVVYLNGP